MNQDSPNFFDKKTLLAIGILMIVWMGWQYYMQQRYPAYYAKKPPAVATKDAKNAATTKDAKNPGAAVADKKTEEAKSAPVKTTEKKPALKAIVHRPEQTMTFQSPNLSFVISSWGMGLKDLHLNKYTSREGKVIVINPPQGTPLPFETRLTGNDSPIDFQLTEVNSHLYVGRATVGGLSITKTMEIDPDKYLLKFKVEVEGSDNRFVGLTNYLTDKVNDDQTSGGLFYRNYDRQQFYVATEDTTDRVYFEKKDVEKAYTKAKIASLGSSYFAQAVVDNSSIMPEVKESLNEKNKQAVVKISYSVLDKGRGLDLDYAGFVGPKSTQILSAVYPSLTKLVDYGIFGFIGKYIMDLLRFFYNLCGNWGWAVVLLTVLVRGLVLPLNVMSYKSMRAMSAIQPQMKAVREKYKDDQQKMNAEVMALMKTNKVNPLGGCLPMLLQFPIFIALYDVLEYSVELYHAPFIFWINDLTAKDPIYVLPVLMGITMYFQQKLTPNTMDPTQAKIMTFMPVFFTIFMVSLPSGLTLYMFVNALMGVIQQMYFIKPQTPTPVTK